MLNGRNSNTKVGTTNGPGDQHQMHKNLSGVQHLLEGS